MALLNWAYSQLFTYGVWPWLLFVAVAAIAAFFPRGPGVFLGHLVVAAVVVVLDVQWIQAAMRSPGWDGQPDQDFVFIIGVVVRIVLINTVLLPVSIVALRLRSRSARPATLPVYTTTPYALGNESKLANTVRIPRPPT